MQTLNSKYPMRVLTCAFIFLFISCSQQRSNHVAVVGFLDLLEDETLAQARKGFFVALKDSGFSDSQKSLQMIYRNAHGDQPTLLQACDYIISQNPDLIAT